jgi:DNA-binding MarR family transcriptional regulator
MRGVEHNGHEALTHLELVLRMEGEFRRSLEPIRVTPLQAGVLIFLQRHMDAKLTDAAATLGLRLPTLSVVVKALVHKRRVTKRRSFTDTRVVSLLLSRQGDAFARQIKQ